MFRFKLRTALVALTAIAALALPASALATNVTDWTIAQRNNPGASASDLAPYAGVPTELLNWIYLYQPNVYSSPEPAPLVYGHRTFGVSLTYATRSPEYQWEFIRRPGHYVTQQIAAGDEVALYNTAKHQYLAWACPLMCAYLGAPVPPTEAFGINLYFSNAPQYQWQVAKGGDSAHPTWADLYNDVEQAYLIPHHHTVGVSLGWIHAPFETGPNYIPPTLPGTTMTLHPVSGSPLPAKGS